MTAFGQVALDGEKGLVLVRSIGRAEVTLRIYARAAHEAGLTLPFGGDKL